MKNYDPKFDFVSASGSMQALEMKTPWIEPSAPVMHDDPAQHEYRLEVLVVCFIIAAPICVAIVAAELVALVAYGVWWLVG